MGRHLIEVVYVLSKQNIIDTMALSHFFIPASKMERSPLVNTRPYSSQLHAQTQAQQPRPMFSSLNRNTYTYRIHAKPSPIVRPRWTHPRNRTPKQNNNKLPNSFFLDNTRRISQPCIRSPLTISRQSVKYAVVRNRTKSDRNVSSLPTLQDVSSPLLHHRWHCFKQSFIFIGQQNDVSTFLKQNVSCSLFLKLFHIELSGVVTSVEVSTAYTLGESVQISPLSSFYFWEVSTLLGL